jgi:bifunctional DNA-binding transcriptional regulator/antitoxin component of YhaV-PrlF toxin-antitoxin module
LPTPPQTGTFTFVARVRNRRRGATRISAKHQITIPADALRASGLEAGERLIASSDGPGRVLLEREVDVLDEYAGTMTGIYEADELGTLRDEWV